MSNSTEQPFTHVLKKSKILVSFRIAKSIDRSKIAEIEKIAHEISDSKEEYEKIVLEEMKKLGSVGHDEVVPGIIPIDGPEVTVGIINTARSIANRISQLNLSTEQKCFLILNLIGALGLSQSDFEAIDPEMFGSDDEDDDEYQDSN